MSITESDRHRLYQRLETILGPDEATTLMEHLPPVGWADVATKRDLEHLASEMDSRFVASKKDIDLLRNDMNTRFAATKKDIEQLRSEMNFKFAAVHSRIEQSESALRTVIAEQGAMLFREQRNHLAALMTVQVALIGILITVLKLI